MGRQLPLLLLTLLTSVSVCFAAIPGHVYLRWRRCGEEMSKLVHDKLGGRPKKSIVLTNAGWAKVQGEDTIACLDGFSAKTGATVGRATLLRIHSAPTVPLWAFIGDFGSLKGCYLEVAKKQSELKFKGSGVEDISLGNLSANEASWSEKMGSRVFGGREFPIFAIANLRRHSAPSELLDAALFHDHLCPGVTSGWLISKFVQKQLPLRAPNESYTFFSIGPWCKEDAIQVVLNCTAGKRSHMSLPADDALQDQLKKRNIAGIVFRFDKRLGKGDGHVLTFRFPQSREKGWLGKLKTVLTLAACSEPNTYVGVLRNFALNGQHPNEFISRGASIYESLGLLEEDTDD